MTLPFIIGSRDQMRMAWPTQDLNRQLPPNKNQKDAVVGQARGINFGPLSLALPLWWQQTDDYEWFKKNRHERRNVDELER